jgi:enoyl-[acyl-carrier protein] reductase I
LSEGIAAGKRILVTGARNKWSIAWHCALSLRKQGARIAYSVYSEREKDDVQKLLAGEGEKDSPILLCDATKMDQVDTLMRQLGAAFDGQLDGLIHGMAFAKREDIVGEYVTTSQDGFALAMDTSVYTLIALSRGARPLMNAAGGGSVVTLTYLGSERVVQGYNVMGVAKAALESSVRYLAYDLGKENIRVNAVSAGPIKTLAASGIGGFRSMLDIVANTAPLRRGVDADEVGDAATFLLSDLSRGITGEILYVDAGYNVMGMCLPSGQGEAGSAE